MNATEQQWEAYYAAMVKVYRAQAEMYRLNAIASELSPIKSDGDYAHYMSLAADYERMAEESEREVAA